MSVFCTTLKHGILMVVDIDTFRVGVEGDLVSARTVSVPN